MRNIILLTFVFIGLFTKSQQVELIENTWYLQKIIIDESEYITPINEEVNKVTINFYSSHFSSGVCNGISGDVQYHSSEQSFTLSDVSVTLMECNLSDNFEFEQLYFWQFLYTDWELAHPFVFSINEFSDFLELTVTNIMGVQAIYHTHNTVAIPESNILNSKLKTYPNPATNQITFELPSITKESLLQIKDIYGKTIAGLPLVKSQTQLVWDCSHLAEGVYLYHTKINEEVYRGKIEVQR